MIEAFYDEMEKISVSLTSEEKRKQMLQFAGLGAVAAPVISGATNLVTHGAVSPFQKSLFRRWLPGQVVSGALAAGAIPAAQHALAQRNLGVARSRVKAEREMKRLVPVEMKTRTDQGQALVTQPIPEVPDAG
jgi:hypothetical protein